METIHYSPLTINRLIIHHKRSLGHQDRFDYKL
jgi:hypothetical protein